MNYDDLILGADPDFYKRFNDRIDDIDDPYYVLTAIAGAINTNQLHHLDCSAESGIVRKILAGSDDTVQQCLLRFIVFLKMSEHSTAVFDRFFLQLLAYYSFYPFDLHHAIMSVSLKKILEISTDQLPYRNVFVGDLIETTQNIPVYSKFVFPSLLFETADHLDVLERGMGKDYQVYLQQLRNMEHRNRQRVITDTLQISRLSQDDYYRDSEYWYEYIPPEEFLASYDRFRELYFYEYDFDYKITRDPEGNLMVLHEPRGMEFRIRLLPDRGDHNLPSCIFHLLDSVLSTIRGSHLVSVDNCFSFVFRTNTMNSLAYEMLMSLSRTISSSCSELKRVLFTNRLLISERNKHELSLFIQEASFPPIEGQFPIVYQEEEYKKNW